MKHTPGPWEAFDPGDYSDYDGKCSVVLGDGMKVRIAVALGTRPEDIANARLIAAAPDLLFQLLAASNYIDALGGDSKSYRQHIAKATGEQQ